MSAEWEQSVVILKWTKALSSLVSWLSKWPNALLRGENKTSIYNAPLKSSAICSTRGGSQPGHRKRLTHWVLWVPVWGAAGQGSQVGYTELCVAALRADWVFIHNPFCLQLSKVSLWVFASSLGKGDVALFKPWRLATAQAGDQGWNASLGHTAASRNQAEWSAWGPGWDPHIWSCSGHWEDGQPAGTPRPAELG